eukprot:g7916.t1
MAGFPDMRDKRLKDYERIFTLVDANDIARTRRRKVLEFFTANMKENLNRSGHIQECSHQCLVLIDELRELMDRLMCWLTLCLPANDYPLSVSHRRKLKHFKNRLRNEVKKLEGLRAEVTSAHSSRVATIRLMFVTKEVSDNNIAGWETAHHELLVMQETEAYLMLCHVWIIALDAVHLLYNYWKINLKDADLGSTGDTSRDYDGGDCCECACTTEYSSFGGGSGCRGGFQCIVDPTAPCVNDDDITVEHVENCDFVVGIGNGYCDEENNNAVCNYDGGDCCGCTCMTPRRTDDFIMYGFYYHLSYVGIGDFACIDPSTPCVDDDEITVDLIDTCDTLRIGNAYCDEDNNTSECSNKWSGFACIDPDAQCVDDDDITVDMLEECDWVGGIGNGYCDVENNTPECNCDGGDCCSCTFVDKPNQECGKSSGFACVDPDAQYVDDEDITVDMLEECNWARGIDNFVGCGNGSILACIDPMAPCVDDDSVTVDMIDICDAGSIGNGYCSDYDNNAECAYDGGDCCSCTCDSAAPGADDDDACQYGFACVDPSAPCVNDDDITVDMLENCNWVMGIGNGYCDMEMNTPECNCDGGDCCECSCEVAQITDDDYFSSGGLFWLQRVRLHRSLSTVFCIGNGYCNSDNNNDLCAYDGGDCVDDDLITDYAFSMSYEFMPELVPDFMSDFTPWGQGGSLPTVYDAVEVGTKTEVGVTATTFDIRPGMSSGMVGSGDEGGDGCARGLTRDGISSVAESRWSCAPKLVVGEEPCQTEYTFAKPQDIRDIHVASFKGNDRIHTMEVHFDGVRIHAHESYVESTYNKLGVSGSGISTVALESIELLPEEWISLTEWCLATAMAGHGTATAGQCDDTACHGSPRYAQ